VGGEGECIKIVQVENGSLAELVEVFLGFTRGFDIPAGTVLLLSSASHAAFVGTAEYAADFIRAAGQLRNAFMGGVTVLHGIPFLLGGTVNTPAIRTLAEVEHWVHITASGTDDISATRKAFMATLRSDSTEHATQHIIRLPVSQTSTEKGTFVTTGFDNLKTAVEPICEEDEKSLLVLLIEELNDLYPLNLAVDIICDRFMDGDVFEENMTDRTALILIGASHLGNIARHINQDRWNVIDLTRPGWRVTSENVNDLVAEVTATAANIDINSARVILQLLDNSVYMVRGPGGETRLPRKDRQGKYHVDGSLVVADKPTVRDLLTTVGPVIRALGSAQKIFLAPLARYWVSPCCSDTAHVTNYHTVEYLPKLRDTVFALRDQVRDFLYIKKTSCFRVLCPNRMMGMGLRRSELSDDDASRTAALWGPDPVHPTAAAYRVMADAIETDLQNPDAKYTNPVNIQRDYKKARQDLSMERASWVSGCSAALARRDSMPSGSGRGSLRGQNTPTRAFARPYHPGRDGDARRGSGHRGSGYRGKRSGGGQHGSRARGGRGRSF
jgi:hypothetical protein